MRIHLHILYSIKVQIVHFNLLFSLWIAIYQRHNWTPTWGWEVAVTSDLYGCHHKHIQVQRSFSRLVSLNVPFIYFFLWTSKTRTASGHLSELASQAAMSKECIWFIRWNDFQMQGEVLAYLFFHYTLLAAITLSQNSLLFSSWHLVFLSCHIYEIFPIYWNREGIWSKQHPTVLGPVSVILSKILSGNRKQVNVLQTWNTFVFSKLCFQNTLILSRE